MARIEISINQALERQENAQEISDEDDLPPLQKSKTVHTTTQSETSDLEGLGFRRVFTGSTLVEQTASVSPESTPSMSSEDVPDSLGSSQLTAKPKPRAVSTSSGRARKDSNMSVSRDVKAFPPSPITSDDLGSDTFKRPSKPDRQMSMGGESTSTKPHKPQDVGEVIADAMKTLSIVRQKEQSARPLRIVRPDPQHQPDEALKQRFQQLVDEELMIRRLNARDWLRVATWWLLKVIQNQYHSLDEYY